MSKLTLTYKGEKGDWEITKEFESFEEAIEMIQIIEKSPKLNSPEPLKCKWCGKEGHDVSTCYIYMFKEISEQQRKARENSTKINTSSDTSSCESVECSYCLKKGHVVIECNELKNKNLATSSMASTKTASIGNFAQKTPISSEYTSSSDKLESDSSSGEDENPYYFLDDFTSGSDTNALLDQD